MNRTARLSLLLLFSIFWNDCINAQAKLPDSTIIDVSRISYFRSILSSIEQSYAGRNDDLKTVYRNLNFKPGRFNIVSTGNVTKKIVIRFTLANPRDSIVKLWLFPGFFVSDIQLYRESPSGLVPLENITAPIPDNLSYRKITVAPLDTTVIYAELKLIRTYINAVRPRLIVDNRLATFVKEIRSDREPGKMVTYVFSGLLLMMILFSLATWMQGKNNEFLYYAFYAFFLGGMLFTKAYYDYRPNATAYFLEGYLDFIMQSLGIMFYMFFMQRFLQTKTYHPFLYKLYRIGIILLLASMIVFTWFHYMTDNYAMEYNIENLTKILLLVMTVIFLVYASRRWKDKLLRYLFWGNLCLLIFSMLSLYILISGNQFIPGIFGSSLVFYEIGLFLELVFFLSGLNHKNRRSIIEQTKERERLKAENLMKEYEKEIAVYKAQQEERERISADMHDELGAGMTAIRLMSEIARNKMKESTPVEIEKISSSANEVLNKMNAIIWSMNSGNDTLDNLVSYIRSYALEYFDGTPVSCRLVTPEHIEKIEVTGDKRRNVFLCVKETLNNTLKHSGATRVIIEFEIDSNLVIRIHDNGKGIDMQNLRQFGNGLKNISRRMQSIGGSYTIVSENGTLTTLKLPL